MKTIYQLRQIAERLRLVTETGGISAEDTFGLQSDVLKYIAEVEQNLEGMGIHKVYASYAMMVEDGANPVGTNGKYLRFGQLVAIWNPSDPTQSENGNVYAWQKGNTGDSAWLLMGNLCSLDMVNGRITEIAEAVKLNSDAIKSNAVAIKSNGDAVRDLSELVERSVRLSELGSYFTSDEFMDCVRSGDVSVYGRWKVTDVYGGIDVVVGVVDVFVDSMLHCLTQHLLTNMVVIGSGELDGSHKHSLHEFYRLYNLSWTEEKLPDGSSWPLNSWSAWKDDLSGVLSSVEELRERMLSAEDKLSVMSVGDHVVMFGGFCSGDVLPNSSTHSGSDEGVSVMWNVTCGRFVLYVEGLGVSSDSRQYMNWSDASRYGSEQSDSGWLPFSDRLYIDESSNTLYYFRDGEIRALSGGGDVDDDESISDDEIVGMF
jgi:hypothetical protein